MDPKPYTQYTKDRYKIGFTLIEIIIVVIALGVVAGLGFNSYNKVIKQGQCRYIQNDLMDMYNDRTIQIAQGKYNYIRDNGYWTPNPNIVQPLSRISYVIFGNGGDDDNGTGWYTLYTRDYNCTILFGESLSSTNPSCSGAGAENYCSPIIN